MSEGPTIKKPTILCNLYEPLMHRLTGEMLKEGNYELIFTRDATEAIPKVSNAQLILSDVSNGGYKLYDYAAQNHPKLPIVFIDGGLMQRERTPAALILEKPYKKIDLITIVELLLNPMSGQ